MGTQWALILFVDCYFLYTDAVGSIKKLFNKNITS